MASRGDIRHTQNFESLTKSIIYIQNVFILIVNCVAAVPRGVQDAGAVQEDLGHHVRPF